MPIVRVCLFSLFCLSSCRFLSLCNLNLLAFTGRSSKMAGQPLGSYPADDGNFAAFPSRRSVVHSTKGVVSTTSPQANAAGLRILREGGNAAVSRVSSSLIHPP